MKTPNTFDDAFSQREGFNTTLLSDNELQDIVTIAETFNAMGEDETLKVFFEDYKDNFISTQEYMKVAQVRDIEKYISQV
jgi:hypothetical protein